MYSTEVAKVADMVILALPLSNFRQLPVTALAGKVVIDAMNYWWEVDGPRGEILPDSQSSSEAVQALLSNSTVVKAFSHLSYHDLYDGAHIKAIDEKKAVAIAGDDPQAVKQVQKLVERFGFAALPIGSLAQGSRLEPGSPAFGASVSLKELEDIISPPSREI